jgi:PAS domain S-box-containing protein
MMLLYFISQTILLTSFATLERQGVHQNVMRARATLDDQLVTLDTIANDWAAWDDTHVFIEDLNERYIEVNLPDATLPSLGLNFMLFFNSAGQLVFSKAADLQNETPLTIPSSLMNHLASHPSILRHTDPEGSITGLLSLPEGPLLFASRPIVTSEWEGPIRGTLILARYLDAAEIASLAEATQLSISISRYNDSQQPLDFQAARAALSPEQPIFVRPLNQDRVAGYALLQDIFGAPAFILRIDTARDIYQQGQATLSYLILALLASGLVFGVVILALLEKGVLSRLTSLSQSVGRIGASGNLSSRVSASGGDELASLAGAINEMLAALGQSEEALRQAHDELEARVEARMAELSAANELLRQEIQERKQVEESLRQSERRFRQVVSSISDHIYVTEVTAADQHINLYISPHVEALTGYPVAKFVDDWSFWPTVVIHPDDRAAAAVQAAQLAQGQNSQVEYRLIRADGEIIWVRDSGRSEKDLSQQSLITYGVVSDITIRKQAEVELAHARDVALEASRLKSQLLANVSHDLRTPLGAILGYADMLQEGIYGPLLDKQRAILSRIMNNTSELTDLVSELLDQAQLEAGTMKLTLTSFTPTDLVDHAKSHLSVLAKTKGLELTAEIDPDLPSYLWGDQVRLRQILTNLVSNAIKFTEQGAVHFRIYRPDMSHWAIQVSDTGPGIPLEAQTYIFDAFRQVDGTTTRKYSGSGLGLSIVKQLVILMGGQITVESNPEQGSVFTAVLPLGKEPERVV